MWLNKQGQLCPLYLLAIARSLGPWGGVYMSPNPLLDCKGLRLEVQAVTTFLTMSQSKMASIVPRLRFLA